tara:strand:- start:111 stop:884 length:774 start_codon:yes stop_codon:yes gene_type:complete
MKSLILALLVGSIFLVLPFVGKAIQGDDSLKLYLPFEEGKGKVAKDKSGNGNDGTLEGETKWIDGKYGKAISLNGKDSGVTVPDSDSLDTPDEITVEAWIYPLNVNVDYPEIVLKGYGTAFEMCVLKDLAIDWEFHIGGWKTVNSGAGTISLKKWLHAAGTYDGKATKVYVNGAKMGNAGHSGDFGVNGAPVLIGYRLRDMKIPDMFFEGIIDDVAIYNRALTEKEIRTDMEEGVLPLAVQSTEKLSTTWGRIKADY